MKYLLPLFICSLFFFSSCEENYPVEEIIYPTIEAPQE